MIIHNSCARPDSIFHITCHITKENHQAVDLLRAGGAFEVLNGAIHHDAVVNYLQSRGRNFPSTMVIRRKTCQPHCGQN